MYVEGLPHAVQIQPRQRVQETQTDERRRHTSRSATTRPRGRRGRGKPNQAIVTMNTQGQPQLRRALAALVHDDPSIVAAMVQEHHARGHVYADMQASAKRSGWKLQGAKARIAETMPAAGTAVAVRADRAAFAPPAGNVDISPATSPGSATAVWADVALPGGILMLSAYLHDGECGSRRNCGILSACLAAARVHGAAWVLAGDMNCTPGEFREHYQWMLDKAGAVLVAAGAPTMYPGQGRARELDYFVVPRCVLPHVLQVERVDTPALVPHRAVKITFVDKVKPYLIKVAAPPRSFGKDRPIGCARRPVAVDERVLDAAHGATREDRSALTGAYEAVMEAIETELCGVTDRYVGERPDPRYCGRAQGLRIVSKPVLPPRRMAEFGRADEVCHAMTWLYAKLQEFHSFSRVVAASRGVTSAQVSHYCRAIARFRRATNMRSTIIGHDQIWTDCWDDVLSHLPGIDSDRLRAWAARAREENVVLKRRAAAQAKATWHKWVRAQLAAGAGALYTYAKRT